MPQFDELFPKLKQTLKKYIKPQNRSKIIVALGIFGLLLIAVSGFFKPQKKSSEPPNFSATISDNKRIQLEKNLESIISQIQGAGAAKVMVTLESSAETVYATEERKNKEASEDKSGEEVTRKKESDDCEKKYITIKDSEGTEHALAITEIEPKIKGIIIICPGGDNPVVKKRITDAVTTALSVPSTRVCVTKSG